MKSGVENHERARGAIDDRRPRPRGVLPRRMQSWIMAGLGTVIMAVILMTGNPAPQAAPQMSTSASSPQPTAPERVRSYQRELADRATRERAMAQQSATLATGGGLSADAPTARAIDPLVDEQRRRNYESLFATNVAHTTRAGTIPPTLSMPMPPVSGIPSPVDIAAWQQVWAQQVGATQPGHTLPQTPRLPDATATPMGPTSSSEDARSDRGRLQGQQGLRILEGTFIETVLLNRLDGTFSGPVMCLVTSPVYSEDRQALLIPSGARLLGAAEPVQTWGESRLAIAFHRLLMPNGMAIDLDEFKGLNQTGETGLKDRVDRHYMQVFGASLAIGAISGLAQWDTRGGFNPGFGDAYRQSAGSSLAASSGRVLDRFLNVLPTVTIREGHRIKVYLTSDLFVPPFAGSNDPELEDRRD